MHITNFTPIPALVGGLTVGLAATLYLFTIGRYAGISGMIRSVAFAGDPGRSLDLLFVLGLLCGGVIWTAILQHHAVPRSDVPLWIVALGGLFVGIGTALGHGCTSGHGVCGLGRLSRVSFVAVCMFVATGFVTVFVLRHLVGVI